MRGGQPTLSGVTVDPEPAQPRRRRHRVLRLGLVAVLGLGVSVGVLSLSGAAAGAATRGCNAPAYSSDGHKASLKCTIGRGRQFQIRIRACDVYSCKTYNSAWVAYGSTARIVTGAFVVKRSLAIYHRDPVCAYTKIGGRVSWCDIRANILAWANRANIHYGGSWQLNWYQDRNYRPDCSGLVDMAWHLGSDPNTDALLSSAYTKPIKRSQLRPGDILDDVNDSHGLPHHVVIFAGWDDASHTHFSVWSFGYGVFKNDAGHHETNDSFARGTKIAGHPQGDYQARRFVRLAT